MSCVQHSVRPSELHVKRESTGSVLATSFAKSGPGSFCSSSPGCSCAGPAEEAVFRGKELEQRLAFFNEGNWQELVSCSIRMTDQSSQRLVRRGRRHNSDAVEAVRAVKLVQLGEVSTGRQALESARVAPGTLATLAELTNQQRRPPLPRDPLPADLANAMPESPFDLDFDRFANNIRSAKRGSAPGPSGMTVEHLHPILESGADLTALFRVAVLYSRGQVPPNAPEAVRLGRSQTEESAGSVLRRLVARTIAQQIGARWSGGVAFCADVPRQSIQVPLGGRAWERQLHPPG